MSCSGGCNNPCDSSVVNTAENESLTSALDNFIEHFFGEVTKTENNGVVTWALPCELDVGLPNNPRTDGEGLACYFLRLFEDGIIGLTGPQGPAGADGAPGANSYTVTLSSFAQPTSGAPNISVAAYANPAILSGGVLFIQSSGWYQINAVGGDGTLFLTLLEAVSGAAGTISAGKLAVMTGPRGITGATGATGAAGAQGPQGDPGDEYTPTHGLTVCTGSDHSLTLAPAQIVFAGTEPELTLPTAGDYLVEIIVGVTMDATAASPTPETITMKVWNASQAAYVNDIEQTVQCFLPNERGQIIMRSIVTTLAANETIQLYGEISVTGKAVVVPTRTSLSYVRLS